MIILYKLALTILIDRYWMFPIISELSLQVDTYTIFIRYKNISNIKLLLLLSFNCQNLDINKVHMNEIHKRCHYTVKILECYIRMVLQLTISVFITHWKYQNVTTQNVQKKITNLKTFGNESMRILIILTKLSVNKRSTMKT